MNNETKRISHIDFAAGILILWVMIFHALNTCKVFGNVDARVAIPFLTFSMPWFFYKSGQLYKNSPIRQGITKDTKKLLKPFIIWSTAGYILFVFVMTLKGTVSLQNCVTDALNTFYIYGYIPLNTPLWFVLSLFFVRVISRFIIKHSIPSIIPITIGLIIGYTLHLVNNPALPFYLANIPMGIVFFMIGYKFGRFEQNKYLFILSFIIYLIFIFIEPSIVGHHRNILLQGNYLLWPIFAYFGIVFFNNICQKADLYLSRYIKTENRPITIIGQNAMTLLVSHALIYNTIFQLSEMSVWKTVYLIFACYAVLVASIIYVQRKRIIKTR